MSTRSMADTNELKNKKAGSKCCRQKQNEPRFLRDSFCYTKG